MFCQKCGNQLSDDAAFCAKCGTKLQKEDTIQQSSGLNQNIPNILRNENGFKEFVDDHIKSTTKFQSAEDLLKNSKPLLFIWVCIGVPSLLGLILGGLLGILIFGGFFGYVATFIASGIIRMRYRSRFSGEFIGDINIEELFSFLNAHLKQIHSHFHEWGYLTQTGVLAVLENAIADASKEVRICSEFGAKKKSLVTICIKPKTVNAEPGEKWYFVDAMKNGFLMDGRAAGFLGHGTLIRTAPILQAAMKYYLQSTVTQETVVPVVAGNK